MTDKPRNWQEDMKLCERYGDSDIPYNASEFSVALPYWLQQYAALKREYERFQKAAMGWNDDLTAAEKAYEGLQTNCVSRGEYEATLKKLDDMTKAYHALLQDKGDTP
ncbi:hypothetical protein C5G87_06920 [Paenibacillus peoriae]|uniref:hypothetical protein n=1 Tax=Paenibacillus peoriae TaxID=59893 RepID=UPI000CEC81FF|nr:hypothetical protein [Paenibacillus peoriae]PPQ49101.1 hypothetical protein C5G87_06920 [Paenibacillus peoriae]